MEKSRTEIIEKLKEVFADFIARLGNISEQAY